MATDWYSLFSGNFEERVRYLGGGKWVYVVEDLMDGTAIRDRFSTKRLIEWVLERDSNEPTLSCQEQSSNAQASEEEEEDDSRRLGPRGSQLLGIAREVGADLCARRLQGWAEGNWPKPMPAPRILAVTGVAERLVWRSYHAVYAVDTRAGPGYLYPPEDDGTAVLVLKRSGSSSADPKWTIRPGRKLLAQIAAHAAAFEALRKPLRD
jgi:hypothetical protein